MRRRVSSSAVLTLRGPADTNVSPGFHRFEPAIPLVSASVPAALTVAEPERFRKYSVASEFTQSRQDSTDPLILRGREGSRLEGCRKLGNDTLVVDFSANRAHICISAIGKTGSCPVPHLQLCAG